MRTMYDAVTAANIPGDAQVVAGYIDKIKLEPWSARDWARFPAAVKVTIVKKPSTNDGHVLDVEPGDATPAQAPGWVRMRRDAGADPTVYCNLSTWGAVRAAFRAVSMPEPHYWIAHYDGDPAWGPGWAESGVVAKQYRGDVPPGIDISSVADYWPGVDTHQEENMPLTPEDLDAIAERLQPVFRDTMRFEVLATGHDPDNPDANTDTIFTFGGRNFADMWLEMLARQAASLAALEAATKDPGITADALRQIVNDAVAQHVQITGEVHIGPATSTAAAGQ